MCVRAHVHVPAYSLVYTYLELTKRCYLLFQQKVLEKQSLLFSVWS